MKSRTAFLNSCVCGMLFEPLFAAPSYPHQFYTSIRHLEPQQDAVINRILPKRETGPDNASEDTASSVELSPFDLAFDFTLPDVVSTLNGQEILSTEEDDAIRIYTETFLAGWYQVQLEREEDDIAVEVLMKRRKQKENVSQERGQRAIRMVNVEVHFRNDPISRSTTPSKSVLNELTAAAFQFPHRTKFLEALHTIGQVLEEDKGGHQVLGYITNVTIVKASVQADADTSENDVNATLENGEGSKLAGENSKLPFVFGVILGSFLLVVGILFVALCILSRRNEKCCGHTLCSETTVTTRDHHHYVDKVFQNYEASTPPRSQESSVEGEKEYETSGPVVVEGHPDETTASLSSSLSGENRLSPISQVQILKRTDVEEPTTTNRFNPSNSLTPSISFKPVILEPPQGGLTFSLSNSTGIRRGSGSVFDADDTSTLDQSYSSLDLPSLLGEIEGLSVGQQSYLMDEEKSFLSDDSGANCDETMDGVETVNVVVSPEDRMEMATNNNIIEVSPSAVEEAAVGEATLKSSHGVDALSGPAASYETEGDDASSQGTRNFEQVWCDKDVSTIESNFSGEMSI